MSTRVGELMRQLPSATPSRTPANLPCPDNQAMSNSIYGISHGTVRRNSDSPGDGSGHTTDTEVPTSDGCDFMLNNDPQRPRSAGDGAGIRARFDKIHPDSVPVHGKDPEAISETTPALSPGLPGEEQVNQPPLCGDGCNKRHPGENIPRKLNSKMHTLYCINSVIIRAHQQRRTSYLYNPESTTVWGRWG